MKILLVTTAFYPEQAIGAVRISKIAKFLHAAGDELTIISLDPAPWSARDESLYFEGLESLTWIRLGQSRFFDLTLGRIRRATVGDRSALAVAGVASSSLAGIKAVLRRQLIIAAQFIFTSLKALDWVIKVRHHARKTLADQTFDIILTCYPSLASPFAGLVLKRMGLASRVVIDFRDPIARGRGAEWFLHKVVERFLLSHCSLASFVSVGLCAQLIARTRKGGFPTLISTNGYDPDDRPNANERSTNVMEKEERLTFFYAGSFYAKKTNFSPVFKAIHDAFAYGEMERGSLVIHYAGHSGALLCKQAQKFNLGDLVVDHGILSRSASIKLQSSCDICLLSTWNNLEDKGILTGKLFEYFLMKKPIIAIVTGSEPESEVKSIIEHVGGGFCFEEGTTDLAHEYQRLKSWIIHQYHVKMTYGKLFCTYNDNVTQYEYRSIVDKFRTAMFNLLVQKA